MGPVAAIAAAAATLFSSSVWSATETPASRSQANPLLDGSVIMETALGLAVIILLIFALGWLLRRFGRLPTGSRGDISVIGGTSLGPRERAVLLQVGHTRLLVGVAPGQYVVSSVDANRLRLDGPIELLRNVSQLIEVADGDDLDIRLGPQEGVTVSGTIAGEGLGNVTGVSLRRPGGPNLGEVDLSTLTNLSEVIELARYQAGQTFGDGEGVFLVEGIPPGTYVLEVYSADINLNLARLPELLDVNLTPWLTQEIVVGDEPIHFALTVSPPPATLTSLPASVSPATSRASANVPSPNGGVSNAPSGPFHSTVRTVARRRLNSSIRF